MRVAAIVVSFQGRHLLERFLPSVLTAARHSRHAVSVYVVDNASTDGTHEWLGHQGGAACVRNVRNSMWAGGNNIGAQRALSDEPATEWLVFLNNDVDVAADFFDTLLDVPDDPSIALVGPKTLFLHQALPISIQFGTDRTYACSAGSLMVEIEGIPDECRARVRPSLRRGGARGWVLEESAALLLPVPGPCQLAVVLRHRKDYDARLSARVIAAGAERPCQIGVGGSVRLELEARAGELVDVINNAGTWIDPRTGECGDIGFAEIDRGQCNRQGRVDAVCGVAMAVRSSVFQHLRGFDERYSLYYEDTDFSARAAERGFRAWINPRASVRHLHSATAREHSASWATHVAASGARFRQRFQDPRRFAAWARSQPDPNLRSLQSCRTVPVPAHLFAGRGPCR